MFTEYAMFTKAGNRAVAKLVESALKLPMNTPNQDLYDFLHEGMRKMAAKHGEVYDTAVRETIIWRMELETKRELSIFEI